MQWLDCCESEDAARDADAEASAKFNGSALAGLANTCNMALAPGVAISPQSSHTSLCMALVTVNAAAHSNLNKIMEERELAIVSW